MTNSQFQIHRVALGVEGVVILLPLFVLASMYSIYIVGMFFFGEERLHPIQYISWFTVTLGCSFGLLSLLIIASNYIRNRCVLRISRSVLFAPHFGAAITISGVVTAIVWNQFPTLQTEELVGASTYSLGAPVLIPYLHCMYLKRAITNKKIQPSQNAALHAPSSLVK